MPFPNDGRTLPGTAVLTFPAILFEGIITSNIAFIHSPIYILSGYPYHTRETVMSTVEENMRLMQTLDDAWNTQDWATFEKRHAKEVDVFWPGQAEPTHGRPSDKEEAVAFFKIFPDNKVGNRPVTIILRTGDYTCSVLKFTGTSEAEWPARTGK